LHMMGTVIEKLGEMDEMPGYEDADAAEDSEESEEAEFTSPMDEAEMGADNEYTDLYIPVFDPDEPWELERSGLSEDENTLLMFNNHSFVEGLDPEAQSPGFNIFERRIVSGKRVGMGLRVAKVPRYIGGEFGLQSRHPLPPPKVRDVQENQVHSELYRRSGKTTRANMLPAYRPITP
jgi:hypothetical protein